jgi:membrane protease YdiL (CAAX protease family)
LTAANVLTSLVFVAAHFFYSHWIWALLVFFPSLVFGYLKERHQSLVSPIIMHAFYNGGYFWLFWQN